MRPIGIDLFAGAGGLSLGFEQAGFDIAAAVEIDPIHCSIHHFNFPNCTTICKSVIDLDGADIRARAGIGQEDIAVVFGGAPCQGFSLIGKRALDDPRNELVHHFVRLVLELQPRYFVFENVKGLTVGKHKKLLEEVMAAFELGGYRVKTQYKVLNAADFGVPQDRRRLFLIGARPDMQLPRYPKPRPRVSVWEAIGDLPEAESYRELLGSDSVQAKFGEPSPFSSRLRGLERAENDYGHWRYFHSGVLTSSARTVHTQLSRQRFADTKQGETEPISRFLKLDPDGLCNTLRAGTASDRGAFTSPRPIHPFTPRCLTVREAARLHSYPDWFRFHVTKWHGFRQIGNSVPPLLAQAVAAELMNAMDETPEVPQGMFHLGEERLLSFTMSIAADYFGVPSNVIAQRIRQHPTRYASNLELEGLGV